MYKVTDEQVDFLLDEIRARGVTIEDLQWNLLDHMCCIIEKEMSETDDFNQFFLKLLPRFFNDNLREIQEESELLLTFKHFYAMKKTLNISGLLAAVFTFIGSTFKIFHYPGSEACIVLGITIFSLIFLPLMIALKFKDETSKTDKIVLSFGFLIGVFTSLGFLFKIMHWPYANILMLGGLVSLTFIYVPLYFFTRFRKPELKFNTTVNSVLMMACGGLIFALYNLGYSTNVEESSQQAYRLLNDEVRKTDQQLVRSLDSTDRLELNQKIVALSNEIKLLKTEILMASTRLNSRQLKKLSETEVYKQLPKDEVMNKIFNASITKKWSTVVSLFGETNKELESKLPESEQLMFDIESIDLASNTSKIALQNLTLMQLHLNLLKLI